LRRTLLEEKTMTLGTSLAHLFQDQSAGQANRLTVELAASAEDIRAAQRLRYRVFVEEMGARIEPGEPGIETDRFDPYCQHLIVRDLDRDEIVGCYRILTDTQAELAGGYYSASEFDLTRILALPGRVMEIGRTCVHPDYRNGGTIGLLWQGLARFMVMNRFDYLMGCASIPLSTGTAVANAVYERLKDKYLAPEQWRVFPRVPLPHMNLAGSDVSAIVPPLVKAYLRAGARICGEPAWDPHFNVADLFILLRTDQVNTRHARHFIKHA
jgi:putative hemolysin